MKQTNQKIRQFFDSDVRERLSMRQAETQQRLDEAGRWFWRLSAYVLQSYADQFDHEQHRFLLHKPPLPTTAQGFYRLNADKQDLPFRPHTPLGEWCVQTASTLPAPNAVIAFDYTRHPDKISDMATHQGQSGWLRLDKLTMQSDAQTTESLVFTALNDQGEVLDADFCRHLFTLSGSLKNEDFPAVPEQLTNDAQNNIENETLRQKGISDAQIVEASQRLDDWADDQVRDLNREIDKIKEEIEQEKNSRKNLADSAALLASNAKSSTLTMSLRKLRVRVEEREDEILAKRERLQAEIRQRMKQKTTAECLLLIRWAVV